MPILNRGNDGLLSLLIVLYRCLRSEGTMPRERLLTLCAPPSVDAERDQLRKTLNKWIELGLFETPSSSDGSNVALAPPFKKLPLDIGPKFRCEVRALLLSDANNQNLSNREGAADLVRTISWLLAEDVYELDTSTKGVISRDAKEACIFQHVNPTAVGGLDDWVAFLGFGWHDTKTLTIDPTVAMRDVLDRVFAGSKGKMAVADFISEVARALPVMDGGTYRTQVENQLRTWRPYRPADISVSLSRGLLRLKRDGNIQLDRGGDADLTMNLLGRGRRVIDEITHVIRPEARA